MKNIFPFLLLFGTLLHATSSDFSIVLPKDFDNALVDVTQNYDRSIAALGITREFRSAHSQQSYSDPFAYLQSVASNYGARLHITRTALGGAMLDEQTIKLEKFATPAAFVKTPDNGYFVGGSTHQGAFVLLRLSPQGTIEWHREFDNTNKDTMNTLVALKEGSVLIVGTTFASRKSYESIFDTGLGGNDISIMKVSKNGALQWSKKYGTQKNDFGTDALELHDGSLVLLGTSQEQSTYGASLIKISQNGDMLWRRNFDAASPIRANKITPIEGNVFLVSLTQKDDVGKNQIRLIKIDAENNILLDKALTTVYPSELFDLGVFANGDIFGVGEVRDAQNTDALVMKFDRDLTLLCQEHFGDQSFDNFVRMDILHNSQIAAVGKHTDPASEESDMWLVKLNNDCTLAQKRLEDSSLHQELQTLFRDEIDAKELAIAKNLLLELHENALYFEVGKYALKEEHKKFLDRFSHKLIPFLLKYRHLIEAIEINGHTSSEWGGLDFSQGYLKNAKLSMNRSYSVLHYLFSRQDTQTQQLLAELLKGSGWSYAKKISLDAKEDREKSRRVTFRIVLK